MPGAPKTFFIIDFDSTFTQVEAMEELAAISLENDPEKEDLILKIKQLTDLAMDGKMPFGKSLKARIALLSAKKYHVGMLVKRLRKRVSTSFVRNKKFFKDYQGQIYIISGGFREFIVPVVKPYFIDDAHVFANTFVYDKKNNITGADEQNPLAQENGKVKLIKQLKLHGDIIVIGDGYTDFQIFEAGLATQFFAFTENVVRENVVKKAPLTAPSLDEILYTQRLPMALSYPKTRIKVVLLGEPTFLAEKAMKAEGYQLIKLPEKTNTKLLNQHLEQSNILLFSGAVDPNKIEKANFSKLLTVGYWGELHREEIADTLVKKGTAVFDANFAHSRSNAELALLLLLQLNRKLGQELSGKKLGIIGYGHRGSMISVLAEHLGVEIFYYDIDEKPELGNTKRVKQLPELLRKVNMLVVTAGKRFEGKTILGSKEIKALQNDCILINLSYDNCLDLNAVHAALYQNKLGGFAMDCLQEETYRLIAFWPMAIISLQKRFATEQTQQNISEMLCEKIIAYINTGNTAGSVNFPELNLPAQQQSQRFIHVHENKPGVLAQINTILARHKINISGQYLKTNASIGYVITDVAKDYPKQALEDLKAIKETIRFRVLY
ncbi:MAG: HAD-IB family phosphatase [Bacteroidota bacterium]|nr:HAD-IB family phosphatase [Bacteroidota bacterium]